MGSKLQNQVPISEMTHLIGMANKAQSEDDFGDKLIAVEKPEATIRAKIRYEMLDEAETNEQLKAVSKIKAWVRYNPLWTAEKLIFWDDKYYEMYAPPELFMGDTSTTRKRVVQTKITRLRVVLVCNEQRGRRITAAFVVVTRERVAGLRPRGNRGVSRSPWGTSATLGSVNAAAIRRAETARRG